MEATSIFNGLMQDLSGRAHIDSEDPKWGALFLAVEFTTDDIHSKETMLSRQCGRLVSNCRTSNNLLKLLEQAASRLEHVMSLHFSPSTTIIKQCCGALHLTGHVMSYLFSHLGPEEIYEALGLSDMWPITTASERGRGEDIIEQLVRALLWAIQNSLRMEDWMYDVLFFSASLTVTLMSSQLFVGTPSVVAAVANELNLPNPDIFNGTFSQNQPFLNYVYLLLERSDTKASKESDLTSKRLLSALLTHVMSTTTPRSSSITHAIIDGCQRRQGIISSASRRLDAVVSALDGPIPADEGYSGSSVWAMNEIFTTLGTFLAIPMKVLQSIILKVQDTRENTLSSSISEDSSTGTLELTSEGLLGAVGDSAGQMTIPVSYTPNVDANSSVVTLPIETCPLVYILPSAIQLCRRPLGERCGQLLLLLIFNKKCTESDLSIQGGRNGHASGTQNSIRDMFCNLVDDTHSDDVSILDTHQPYTDSHLTCKFRALAMYLANDVVSSETANLLIYCMLQYNSTFLHSLMASKGDSGGVLMISLLRRMYAQEEQLREHDTKISQHIMSNKLASKKRKKKKSGRFHLTSHFSHSLEPLYVTVINTLILSQDRSFSRYMFSLPQSNVGGVKRRRSVKEEHWRLVDSAQWYKERNLGADVSLGDIAILCVLRTALLALFRQKDKYLLSNCLAILSNLGPHVANLHAYTAERVVTIIEKLGKRIIDTELKYLKRSKPSGVLLSASPIASNKPNHRSTGLEGTSEPLTPTSIANYTEIMQNMQDTVRVVLNLVCRALRPAQQISNVQLIYALIRGGEKVCCIVDDPMIMDIVESRNLDENGLAHIFLPTDIADSKDGKKASDKGGMKKFVNKLGNIISSVVNKNKRYASLPHVDMSSTLLPIVYIPLLIKHGIKWMERTRRGAMTHNSTAKETLGRDIKDKGLAAASPSAVVEQKQVTAASVEPARHSDESYDDFSDGASHRTAQEAVNDLITWIGSESQVLYEENDNTTSPSTPIKENKSISSEAVASTDPEKISIDIIENPSSMPSVVLTYEEGPTPQDFFVPYLWSVVMRTSPDVPICISQTSSVDVISAGLVDAMLIVAEEKMHDKQ